MTVIAVSCRIPRERNKALLMLWQKCAKCSQTMPKELSALCPIPPWVCKFPEDGQGHRGGGIWGWLKEPKKSLKYFCFWKEIGVPNPGHWRPHTLQMGHISSRTWSQSLGPHTAQANSGLPSPSVQVPKEHTHAKAPLTSSSHKTQVYEMRGSWIAN